MKPSLPRCCLLILPLWLAVTSFGSEAVAPVSVGDPAKPESLQADIVAAYLAGSRKMTVTPGVYVIPGVIGLTGLEDVEISAYGVELAVDSVDSGAIAFVGCKNLTFSGAVLRYTKPHTGQAKILAIGEDEEGDYCDIQLEPGFPTDSSFKITGVVDGRTLRPKADGGSARILKPLDEAGKLRLYWTGVPGWKKVPDKSAWAVPGDYLVCRGPAGMMCYAKASERCTFQDITIYWGGQFGFYETHSSSENRYIRNIITYGPVPPGGRMRPLASQSADGLHSGGSKIGPTMENCFFEGQMDDGVNIHGSFYQVAKTEGRSLTLGFPSDFLDAPREYEPGDTIGIYDLRKKQVVERKIVSVQASEFSTKRTSQHERFRNFPMHFTELTLDGDVDAPFDSVAWFPARCGAGYKITGCTVRDSWSRGFLLKADNGLLADSLIERCAAAGIVVTTEMNWAEAGYSRNVTIRGNTLRGTTFWCGPALGDQGAALVVTTTGMQGMAHQYIDISNNTFEDINLTNMLIRWARDVTIKGNRFVNPLQQPNITGDVGKAFGIDSRAVVWIGDSERIALTDNRFVNKGSLAQSLLSLSPTARNVEGTLQVAGPAAK